MKDARCSSMLGVYEKQGVRHGDGVVEVDGVRCVELTDDVCATAALTEQREEYMVLVEVVHFFVLLPLLCCLFCARTSGRKTDAEQVSEHECERAWSWKVQRCCVRDARRGSLAVSVARRTAPRARGAFFPRRCAIV